MTDISTVQLGFVGLGNIAQLHCDRLQDAGLGDVVAAGMDVDPDARQSFAEKYDATVYEDTDELYASVDAVLVTTPNKFHEEYVVGALEAGLDVLVEKPLAHSLESAERIAAAAADAPGFCMVGFHNRFANPVQALVGYCEAGTLGDVSHVEADYIRRRGVPGRGSWFTRQPIAGGGSLIDIGAHAIDLSLYLLGYPDVVEVCGETRAQFGTEDDYAYVTMWGEDQGADEFSVDDSASAFIRCADGSTVNLEVAWATNRPDSQQYYVRGDEAGAGLNLADGTLELYETASTGVMHHRTSEIETRDEEPHAIEQQRFVEAVASGDPPATNTVEQALTVQRVMDAIYRSSEQERAVSLD
ncbi:Gfo/Idh/MocA family oxidoreductase [Halomicroarcula sp. S1AR25-4]|uniref:Gfo/Idh/MocA family protein n=1 Tax=Haloarcula sp. S1AR25-4 TaxID=2950538 RepID=UPI002875693A|nr:Gfo/Idh/MocA family oxidoreductase [Halomicroarcula sp. S1AR25-4]MDS0276643.1 Gfo/Idh/MocA family oxidoreductase [Halomicroarcula sp. S1AR25-4]